MKKVLLFLMVAILCGCVKSGEFTPETNQLYEMGKVDCEKTPERCYKGVPW